ncbi:fused uroporphyrinogen-III synthase HemD/membrane protein HemX [Robbsia sp. KACC 23696]|uniref:fused uroporphyrinogen-III synthase HemD/membrane protein HemX n=1 Tax=Robbsia sp. KACC 23696 TaxID=3149231 RepID=UPI00325A7753
MSTARPFAAILTRPAGQSAPLATLLARGGVEVIDFPLIGIAPTDDVASLQGVLATLQASPRAYRLVFFVSPNAVAHAFAYAASQGLDLAAVWRADNALGPAVEGASLAAESPSPSAIADGDAEAYSSRPSLSSPFSGGTLIAAVGPGTLLALGEHGIHPASHRLVAPEGADTVAAAMRSGDATQGSDAVRFDSEALVAALDTVVPRAAWQDARVLIVRGDGGREWFADLLRDAGARIDIACAYRRMLPSPDTAAWRPIEAAMDAPPAQAGAAAWVLGSSEAVRNLRALAGARFGEGERLRALLRMPVLAPHPRIADAAERAGFDTIWHPGAGDLNLARTIFAASERLTKQQNTDGMTEEKTGNTAATAAASPGATAASGSAAQGAQTSASKRFGASYRGGGSPAGNGAARRGTVGLLWVVVVVAVAGAAGGGWWLNERFNHALDAVRAHQAAGDSALSDAQQKSAQSLSAAQQLNAQLTALSGKVSDTQTQQQALRQMYQDLARNHDDWVMTQAEQTLSSANQQLQLTGNVHMALYALQNADSELSTSSAPQVLDVRRAIASDIDKLNAVKVVDVPGLALRLDQAIAKVDGLPLSGDVAPRADAGGTAASSSTAASMPAASASDAAADAAIAPWYKGGVFTAAYWRAAWAKLTHRAGDSASRMVTIRRIDRSSADAMLIAPDQDAYLRENVTLRLLSARLSLLAHNEAAMQSDLAAADDALAKYFDPSAPAVEQVRTTIASVRAAAQHVDVPTIDGSLQALRQNKSRG